MVEAERTVLAVLANTGLDACLSFEGIRQRLRGESGRELDRSRVRRSCRALARKGLAEYHCGLWNDEGEPAGAGYCVSKAGLDLALKEGLV